MPTCLRSAVAMSLLLLGCSSNKSNAANDSDSGGAAGAKNPDAATVVAVDRFSDAFAHLFKRSANASLPGPNAPIDFDQGPFITHGLGPAGERVTYYNFDVLPTAPAPIYVFFQEGSTSELTSQLHVIDVIPGDPGYNDFWQVTKVTVPASYVPNSVTSAAEIQAAGFSITPTTMLVNCPVVPQGSTAALRYTAEPSTLVRGWYRDQIAVYLSFDEHALSTTSAGEVPTAPIFVAFNANPNPNDPMSGPPSGFEAEPGSLQTHNVLSVLPENAGYSPLWQVSVYDDASFGSVHDLASAMQAPNLVSNAGLVNCPAVAKGGADGG